uniref:Uncharacterized protein n=1 Tax=Arundo donax TaxID=35708 RepID=A0A0A8XQJ0_ARUDO
MKRLKEDVYFFLSDGLSQVDKVSPFIC